MRELIAGIDPRVGSRHFSRIHRWLWRWRMFFDVWGTPTGYEPPRRVSAAIAWSAAEGVWRKCECYGCNPGRREAWQGPLPDAGRPDPE